MQQSMRLLTSSKADNWQTPSQYIEAARAVMGGIDLDPASNATANQAIKATTFYTKEQDGLTQPWHGRVFCNPPYGKTRNKSNQGLFAAKLVEEYEAGRVQEAILLVNLYVGYDWFAPLRGRPLCQLDHRIAFIDPATGKQGEEAKASSVFVYFGNNPAKFFKIFSQFGFCGQLHKLERQAA